MPELTEPFASSVVQRAANDVLLALSQERLESWGAPADDWSSYGFEWHFKDGSKLWFDIDKDKGFSVYWRQGQSAGGDTFTVSKVTTSVQSILER